MDLRYAIELEIVLLMVYQIGRTCVHANNI